jgi:hypothetical protein
MGGKSSSSSASTTTNTSTAIDNRIGAGDGALIATGGSSISQLFESVDPELIAAALDAALGFVSAEAQGARDAVAGNTGLVLDFARAESSDAFDFATAEGAGSRALIATNVGQSLDFAATESAGARQLSGAALELTGKTFEEALAEVGKSRQFAQDALGFARDINQSAFDFQSTVGELGGLKEFLKSGVALGAIAVAFVYFSRKG